MAWSGMSAAGLEGCVELWVCAGVARSVVLCLKTLLTRYMYPYPCCMAVSLPCSSRVSLVSYSASHSRMSDCPYVRAWSTRLMASTKASTFLFSVSYG
jgi:hypothetical protein